MFNLKHLNRLNFINKSNDLLIYFTSKRFTTQKPSDVKQKDNTNSVSDFKSFEEMNPIEISQKMRENRKEVYYYSGSKKRFLEAKTFNKSEFVAKKLRHMWLQGGDMNTHKHILPIKRIRERKDTLFGLLKNGEIAGVIEGREEFPDFHFVMDRNYTSRLEGIPHGTVKPYYLQYGSDEIRCTLIRKDRIITFNQPYKARFQRYIVGRPNLLTLPIKLTGRNFDPVLRDMDVEIAQYHNEVEVWCKNDEYPPLFEIDTILISPGKPFKFLDLNLLLPEGMWLHRKYDNIMYSSIASMGENFNYILSSKLFPLDDVKENISAEGEVSDQTKNLENILNKSKSVKKKKDVSMPFGAASSKKILQSKTDGADRHALRNTMKAPASDKKAKKPVEKKTPEGE